MMADELLNAQDLITAKKHDTFHSEVITGKTGGLSTGANIDYATNAVTGQVQKTLPKVIDDLDWSYVGLFADGVTFTDKTDFAVDAVGTQWIYTGSLPFSATAGTVPSEPTYQVVHVKSASAISNANGGSVQDFIDAQDATLAHLAAGAYAVGLRLQFAELDGAEFDVVAGGTPNGLNIRDAGSGNTAVYRSEGGRIDFKHLGGVVGGVSDNRALWVSTLAALPAMGYTLVISAGVYGFSGWIPLVSNSDIVFEAGSEFKLLQSTGAVGGFVIGGVDADFNPIPYFNSQIFNMVIDCNNLVGENAFSALNAENINLFNPVIKNCLRSDTALGGRAFQFEGGVARNVNIYNPQILDCSIGINSQADPSGTYIAEGINYYDVVMRNVDVPFNIDSGFLNPENNIPLTMSTTVNGGNLYNCGRLTYLGVSDPVGGGIICGDRGSGLSVSNVRVINEVAYGGIGAIVRGTMFGVKLKNISAHLGSGATSIFDHNPVSFGYPSTESHASFVDADDVAVVGNLDYIVETKTGGGALGASMMRNVTVNSQLSSLAAIVGPNASSYTDAQLMVIDSDNSARGKNKATALKSLSSIVTSGNTLNSDTLGDWELNETRGVWTPSYSAESGTTASLVMSVSNAVWVRQGRMCNVSGYISTNDFTAGTLSGAVYLEGLPFTSSGYALCAISFASGFINHPLSGCVIPGENKIRLFKRSSSQSTDETLLVSDMTAGVSTGVNAFILSIQYETDA